MEKYEQLKTLIESLQADIEKFETSGNNAAGTRFRQGLQTVKKLAQEIRVENLAASKANKAK